MEEQFHLLELFFRRDYESLTQALEPAPAILESDEWREKYWAQIKEWRALRGQPAELTHDEQNLSEEETFDLLMREAKIEGERQHAESTKRRHEEAIKHAQSFRLWGLIISAVGALLTLLLYVGWLPDKFLGFSMGEWSMIAAMALVGTGLQHLELRALRIGTERARKQRDVAMLLAGAVAFLGSAIAVAALLAIFLSLLVPWLSGRLPQNLASVLVVLDRGPGILVVGSILLAAIGVVTAAAFVYRRHWKATEPISASISAAAWIGLGPFAFLAFGPMMLMFPIFLASMTLMAIGFTSTQTWLESNFALAALLMIPVTVLFTAIAYLHGRWRASQWEDKSTTLIGAAMFVVGIYVLGSVGVCVLLVVLAALIRANGVLG